MSDFEANMLGYTRPMVVKISSGMRLIREIHRAKLVHYMDLSVSRGFDLPVQVGTLL